MLQRLEVIVRLVYLGKAINTKSIFLFIILLLWYFYTL